MLFFLATTGVVFALLWVAFSPPLLAYITAFLLIYIAYKEVNEPYERSKSEGHVGPEPKPFLGNMLDLRQGFFQNVLFNYNKYRKEGRRCYVSFAGRRRILHLLDPDDIKLVTIKEASTFTDRMTVDFNATPLDLNLLAISGDHWKHVRSQITPTFSSGRLRAMTPLIQLACDKIVSNVAESVEKDKEVDIKEMTGAFTLDVIASTLFGLDIDSQKNPDDIFVVQAKKIFAGFGFSNIVIILAFLFPKYIHLVKNLSIINKGKPTIDFFRKVTEECLRERKANPDKHRDFLQLMVDCEVPESETDRVTTTDLKSYHWSSKGLTPDEILAQAIVFFLAGYETTANTLVFLIYLLCVYPEAQEKVADEIREQLGDELPNYDNVGKLAYLDMCLMETSRLYPQAPRIDRQANKTIEIGGMIIPQNQVVAIDIAGFHRDPEYWSEPEKFIPERFVPEERNKRHPAVHLPFGIGPRNCVGMRLAQLEMKMAVVQIIQKFRIIPAESTPQHNELKMSKIGIAIPETPIKLKFTERY